MTSAVVNPRFSEEELREIDYMVSKGKGKSRADYVRKATNFYVEKEKEKEARK